MFGLTKSSNVNSFRLIYNTKSKKLLHLTHANFTHKGQGWMENRVIFFLAVPVPAMLDPDAKCTPICIFEFIKRLE